MRKLISELEEIVSEGRGSGSSHPEKKGYGKSKERKKDSKKIRRQKDKKEVQDEKVD